MFYLRMPDLESRTSFIAHLKRNGITAVFHYQPLHLSKVGRRLDGKLGQCPISEKAANDLVRLPLYADLDEPSLEYIIETIHKFRT